MALISDPRISPCINLSNSFETPTTTELANQPKEVWFGEAGNLVQVYNGSPISSFSLAPVEPLDYSTTYGWQIVGKNDTCDVNGPIWTFTTYTCECEPPEKPEGQNQTRNRYRYEYATRIMNMHQHHNGLYYQFSWGDGNYSEWIGPYNNSERVRAQHEWTEPGNYQVQARARFENNPPSGLAVMVDWVYTGWSEPLAVVSTVAL